MEVSVKTIRRVLHEAGLSAAEKKAKPKLSPANIKARLEFARSHEEWTIDDWKQVIATDETKINRFGSDGRAWYWKREGERRQARHIKQTVNHGGDSIMIWGCIKGTGPHVQDQRLHGSTARQINRGGRTAANDRLV